MNSEKAGGIFTKGMYDPLDEEIAQMTSDEEIEKTLRDATPPGPEPRVSGFINTRSKYRLHHKVARVKGKMKHVTSNDGSLHMADSISSRSGTPKGAGSRYGMYKRHSPPPEIKPIRMGALDADFASREAAIREEFASIFKAKAAEAADDEGGNKNGPTKPIDGLRMITEFCDPNPMTRWAIKDKYKKRREKAVENSYTVRKQLQEKGHFDYI